MTTDNLVLYPISFRDMDCLFREVGPRDKHAFEEWTIIEVYQKVRDNELKKICRWQYLVDVLESIIVEEQPERFLKPIINY